MRLIDEACKEGARLARACRIVGLSARTLERWKVCDDGDDMRLGPKTKPSNALSSAEEGEVLRIVNLPEYRNLSPKQIVPILADCGIYIASESTIVRILRREGQDTHRGPKKPRTHSKPREKKATGPCQVWSWDITLLRTPVVGHFFYLYMAVDVWSRKIVAYRVYDRECSILSTTWMTESIEREGACVRTLVLHSDNGGPMKGTLKASLENLGVLMTYSRPQVSNDNPYSESLFGTMKTRPDYPTKPFETIESAQTWCDAFVAWYNDEHRHSAIGYVTPNQRHDGESTKILEKRRCLYQEAKKQNPNRWSKDIRKWDEPKEVLLNPDMVKTVITNN